MPYDLLPLITAHALVSAAQSAVTRACTALEHNREIEKEERVKLFDLVRPIFLSVIPEFNVGKQYGIVPECITLEVSVKERRVFLDVLLKDERGNEPDEWFDNDEREQFSAEFAVLINPKLAKEGIPLTFGGFIFPHEYLTR